MNPHHWTVLEMVASESIVVIRCNRCGFRTDVLIKVFERSSLLNKLLKARKVSLDCDVLLAQRIMES